MNTKDQDVLDERARRNGRSREEEVHALIADATREARARATFFERARELREALRASGRSFSDSTDLVRRSRDRG